MMPPFLFRIILGIWGFVCFLKNFRIVFSSSVKSDIRILTGMLFICVLLLVVWLCL